MLFLGISNFTTTRWLQGWFRVHTKNSVMALTPSPLSVMMMVEVYSYVEVVCSEGHLWSS